MIIDYDTEFYEDGKTISLISIGMVAEDGREFYAISMDLPWRALREHPFLSKEVAPYLPIKPHAEGGPWDYSHPDITLVTHTHEIAQHVSAFIKDTPDPELWAYFSAYDHVALAQLFGPMVDMPKHIPWHTNDIQQERRRLGMPKLPKQTSGHHKAIDDARWNGEARRFLQNYAINSEKSVAE